MLADSLFVSNAERIHPETAAYIRKLMEERGIRIDDTPKDVSKILRESAAQH